MVENDRSYQNIEAHSLWYKCTEFGVKIHEWNLNRTLLVAAPRKQPGPPSANPPQGIVRYVCLTRGVHCVPLSLGFPDSVSDC